LGPIWDRFSGERGRSLLRIEQLCTKPCGDWIGRIPTKNFKQAFSNLLRDESGQDLIEYALVASVIALGAVAAMSTLGGTIRTTFSTIGNRITAAV
jgi:pilus assembly protein Flp/PilA